MWREVISLGVVSALAVASPASAISFDLSGGGDFGPRGTEAGQLSASAGGLTLTLTASSLIPEAGDALGGDVGVVFIDAAGAGVRTGAGKGSKEISGGGGHRDEALHFAWSMPVGTSSVALTLTKFSGSDSKKGTAAVVYVDDPTQPLLTEAMVLTLLDPVIGEQDTFFLNLAGASGLPSTLSSLSIRATNGHFLVSRIIAVPEPSTFAFVGAGLVGMVWAGRRGGARGSAAPRDAAIKR